MGRLFALPASIRARLAIVGSLACISVLVYIFYIFGSPLLEGRHPPPPITVVDDGNTSSLPAAAGVTNDSSNQPRVLLVTAMFQLANSTKPMVEDTWVQHFLGDITSDIYIFTTPALESHILQFRGSSNITVDTSYSTPFDIPPLKGKEDAYTQMQKKDRQRSRRHSPELSALRNSKPFFLHTALQKTRVEGSFVYDYVFWSDVANFHEEHQYRQWPSPSRVRQVWEEGTRLIGTANSDELMFIPMWGLPHSTFVFWNEGMGPIDNDFGQESFFGGPPKAIDWYTRTFYAYHDKYLSLDIFIGKDQATTNALLVLFPDHFITVWYNDPIAPAHLQLNRTVQESFLGQCDSERLYYQFWLADEETQDKMRNAWIRKQDRWKWWGWWRPKDRVRCQLTRALAMKEVLRRPFGTGWEPPSTSVPVPAILNWDL